MEFVSAVILYTGTIVVGFFFTYIYDFYHACPDAKLVNVGCQTDKIEKIKLTSFIKKIQDDDLMNVSSDDSGYESDSSVFEVLKSNKKLVKKS